MKGNYPQRATMKTISYKGICYSAARDNQPSITIVETYGSVHATVLKQTLAGALCFGEPDFAIETSINQRPVMLEHYTITDATTAQYTYTGKETLKCQ